MKAQTLFIWLGFLSLLAQQACTDDSFSQIVEIEIPEHTSLPTLSMDLRSSDTIAQIIVNKSLSILDQNEFAPIDNTKIQLLRNGALLTDNFSLAPGDQFFKAQLPAPIEHTPGVAYRVQVEVPGVGTAFAEQVMPAKPMVSAFVFSPDGGISPDGERVDEIKVTIEDVGGEKNYYALDLIEGWFEIDQNGDTIFQTYSSYIETNDPVLSPGKPYALVFSDEAFDGGRYTARAFKYGNTGGDGFAVVRVYQLTRDAFLYARSFFQFWDSNGNPFAEPVTVHGNVTGGYGAFILSNYLEFRIQ
ncbi:MAG: DUF4249 domain-containing protein [Saprospiraceae bacterium]|nr:DUF4249 domain-containing protein [Saprospiraceae bacterium]